MTGYKKKKDVLVEEKLQNWNIQIKKYENSIIQMTRY
jgi:ATP-dependent RNA circularization protein (DNA/RNA ligase family)